MSWNQPSFDTATTAGGAPVPEVQRVCQRCNMMLDNDYTLVHGKPACEYCAVKLKTEKHSVPAASASPSANESMRDAVAAVTAANSSGGGAPLALAYGFAASLVSATVYAGVVIATQFEIGFMAVGVGWLIGKAVRRGNGAEAGTGLKIGAILLVYLAMVLAYSGIGVHAVYNSADSESAAYKEMLDETVGKLNQAGAGVTAGVLLISVLSMALVFPFAGGLFGLLFVALGMHQAWATSGAKDEEGDLPADPVHVRPAR